MKGVKEPSLSQKMLLSATLPITLYGRCGFYEAITATASIQILHGEE